jgi:hypothetical protein
LGAPRIYTQLFAPLVERRLPLDLGKAWESRSEFTYTLPEAFQLGELPRPVEESSPFGSFALAYERSGPTIVARARFAVTASRVEVRDYQAFREFLRRADQALSKKVSAQRVSADLRGAP